MKSHSGSWLSTVTFLSVSSQILPPGTNVQYYMNGPRANKRDEFSLPLAARQNSQQPSRAEHLLQHLSLFFPKGGSSEERAEGGKKTAAIALREEADFL